MNQDSRFAVKMIVPRVGDTGGIFGGAVSAPLDVDENGVNGLHVDRYSGQVPPTVYVGAGGGGAYTGGGAGVNGPFGLSVDLTLLLPPGYPARCSTNGVRTLFLKRLLQHGEG
jgi:hypothetical protein